MNHSSTKANGVFFAWQRADQICDYQRGVHALCMVNSWGGMFKVMVNENYSALSSHFILPPILFPIFPSSIFTLLSYWLLCSLHSTSHNFLTLILSIFYSFHNVFPFSLFPPSSGLSSSSTIFATFSPCRPNYLLSNTHHLSPPPLASDMASDQGQVLVIVTAAVGGFTLLVILTLFLLITGR